MDAIEQEKNTLLRLLVPCGRCRRVRRRAAHAAEALRRQRAARDAAAARVDRGSAQRPVAAFLWLHPLHRACAILPILHNMKKALKSFSYKCTAAQVVAIDQGVSKQYKHASDLRMPWGMPR